MAQDNQPQDPGDAGQGVEKDRHDAEEGERRYTISISEENRQRSFQIEDERWATGEQVKDWLKLALMIAIDLAWMLIVYLLEPGLR